jgi:hypothetical protein
MNKRALWTIVLAVAFAAILSTSAGESLLDRAVVSLLYQFGYPVALSGDVITFGQYQIRRVGQR